MVGTSPNHCDIARAAPAARSSGVFGVLARIVRLPEVVGQGYYYVARRAVVTGGEVRVVLVVDWWCAGAVAADAGVAGGAGAGVLELVILVLVMVMAMVMMMVMVMVIQYIGGAGACSVLDTMMVINLK